MNDYLQQLPNYIIICSISLIVGSCHGKSVQKENFDKVYQLLPKHCKSEIETINYEIFEAEKSHSEQINYMR